MFRPLTVLFASLFAAGSHAFDVALLTPKTGIPLTSPNAKYKIDMVVEQDVEEGSPQDTDVGPDNDVIMCMELSMATHMDQLVQKYTVEELNRDDIVDPWKIKKLTHHIDSDNKIVLYVKNNSETAVIKVFSFGETQGTFETALTTSSYPTTQGGTEIMATGTGDNFNARSLRRKKRRRNWATDLVGDADCGTTCNPDDGDAGGGHATTSSTTSSTTFGMYMGIHLQQHINEDCPDVMVSNLVFYQKL